MRAEPSDDYLQRRAPVGSFQLIDPDHAVGFVCALIVLAFIFPELWK